MPNAIFYLLKGDYSILELLGLGSFFCEQVGSTSCLLLPCKEQPLWSCMPEYKGQLILAPR